MKKVLLASILGAFSVSVAQAAPVKLTHLCATPDGATGVSAAYLAEVAAKYKVATIQTSCGKTLTKTMQQVAEGKADISASPFILNFLMARGLGPYAGLGKKKGAELASNLRVLYSYDIATFYLVAFASKGIDSWDKLKGKTIFNGPPRGGATTTAKAIIGIVTGMKEGDGYTAKHVSWPQANSIFLDGGVAAAVRPGNNPPTWIPIYEAAGQINIVSVPKAIWEGKGFQKLANGPGAVPIKYTIKDLNWGKTKVISEDGYYRSLAQQSGDVVNKSMSKALAKKLTAAFIKDLDELKKKTPWAPGALYGNTDAKRMGFCGPVGVKFHPGAIEAWEEAGRKIADCAKP